MSIPYTYEYVARLHERTGGPKVQVVTADFSRELARKRAYLESGRAMKRTVRPWTEAQVERVLAAGLEPTGIPFLDLCRANGIFPTRRKRFCTVMLKRLTIFDTIFQPLIDAGYNILSWQGIRALESKERACLPMWEVAPESEHLIIYRPIIGWTVKDDADMHRRHDVKLNPLYGLGFNRVGCMPCINATKLDLRLMARMFPEYVKKIGQWEKIVSSVSRKGRATFFTPDRTPGPEEPLSTKLSSGL